MNNSTIKKASVIRKGQRHINTARTVAEAFDMVRQAETQEEKVELLRAYNSKGMRYIVNGMYNVDWSDMNIPKVRLLNKPPEICPSNLNSSIPSIEAAYTFRTTKPDVTERNLVKVLESISAQEAELLLDMFKGKKVEGISKAIFKRAFPEFFRTSEDSDSE